MMRTAAIALGLCLLTQPAQGQTSEASSVPAYVVNEITVTDPAVYADYARKAPATVAAFGGRYLARGGTVTPVYGEAPRDRVVIVVFPSRQAALDWRGSAAYQRILPLRESASTSRVYIVDGVETP